MNAPYGILNPSYRHEKIYRFFERIADRLYGGLP
jgi:hypothetical protein